MKNNHFYGYRACWLPSMLHWNYSFLHVCFKCDTLVHFNNNVSVFWKQAPCIIIFAFLLKNLLRSLRSRQLFSNLSFSVFHIFQKNLKLNLKLPKIELNCLILSKIENWIENCQKIDFQFFSLSEKLKIELKITQNQSSVFWNYWKLSKNEMDVFVHGCSKFTIHYFYIYIYIFFSNLIIRFPFSQFDNFYWLSFQKLIFNLQIKIASIY